MSADNAYSRFVNWAKIILPLGALVLLSTLFLLARTTGDTADIPFADLQEITSQQRISAPTISGVTNSGDAYQISADVAKFSQENTDQIQIDSIAITINSATGTDIDLIAGTGEYDSADRMVALRNLVRITTTNGYVMETIGAWANLGTGDIETTGILEVRSPFGEFTAGHLSISRDETGAQQMVFNEGVRLVYEPQP